MIHEHKIITTSTRSQERKQHQKEYCAVLFHKTLGYASWCKVTETDPRSPASWRAVLGRARGRGDKGTQETLQGVRLWVVPYSRCSSKSAVTTAGKAEAEGSLGNTAGPHLQRTKGEVSAAPEFTHWKLNFWCSASPSVGCERPLRG